MPTTDLFKNLTSSRFPESGEKVFTSGTERTRNPEETVSYCLEHAPQMGITRLADLTYLDTVGIPTWQASRPNSRSVTVSQGKGLTDLAAQASALMESVEGYHSQYMDHHLRYCSYKDLLDDNYDVVNIERLPRQSNLFTPDLKMLWVSGFDLLSSREKVFVPYELVCGNYTLPLPPGFGTFISSSNGLASGNHPIEAVLHALYEVVERDSTAMLDIGDKVFPQRVDLATINNKDCLDLLDRFTVAGIEIGVFDITSDIEVPAFYAVGNDTEPHSGRVQRSCTGSGCHSNRAIALSRALTEVAQSRLTRISSTRDDAFSDSQRTHNNQDLIDSEREKLATHDAVGNYKQIPTYSGTTLAEDLNWTLNKLEASGIQEAIAIDLTKETFEIPVFQVVVPGLEHASNLHKKTTRNYIPARPERVATW